MRLGSKRYDGSTTDVKEREETRTKKIPAECLLKIYSPILVIKPESRVKGQNKRR